MSQQNRLYYGDNLDVLRRAIKDESVDSSISTRRLTARQGYSVLFA
jgi:hypothetical protein